METNELIIKPLNFTLRTGKYALIPRLIHNVDQTVDIKGKILNLKMSGFEQIFTELVDRGAVSALGASILRDKAEQNEREDIEEYLPILFNQALVMMCTVFDVFLIESLEIITRKQPTILHSLTDPKDISITEVINAADHEALIDTIRERALKRFDYGGIQDKVRILNKRVDLDTDGIFKFKFQGDATRNKFPDSCKSLVSAYRAHATIRPKSATHPETTFNSTISLIPSRPPIAAAANIMRLLSLLLRKSRRKAACRTSTIPPTHV